MVIKQRLISKAMKLVDFTQSIEGFEWHESFNDALVRSLREHKVLVIVDRGYGLPNNAPHIVTDHINLTGDNPLVGPNQDAIGERFPAAAGIYVRGAKETLPCGVAAGLKPGVLPDDEELAVLKRFGADFYCYNLVPAALVAAHAKWKLLAVVAPEGVDVSQQVRKALENYVRSL